MEWLTSIRTAIDYMEEHLADDISAQDVADRVHLSLFFLILRSVQTATGSVISCLPSRFRFTGMRSRNCPWKSQHLLRRWY